MTDRVSVRVRYTRANQFAPGRYFVKELTFAKLINECHKSLNALMAESQQTLSLVDLVRKYPQDPDRRSALQQQCQRENRLRLAYQERRTELLRLMSVKNESDNAA